VRVAIDRKTGDYETFRRWKVFADDSNELEFPERELRLEDALDLDPGAAAGRLRRAAHGIRRFRPHRGSDREAGHRTEVREAERSRVVANISTVSANCVSGLVKRVDRNGIFVDLGGNAEGFIPR
jgi:N utilization substance protein A